MSLLPKKLLSLGADQDVENVMEQYPMRISKYYLSRIKEKDDPIWKQCVPDKKELEVNIACRDPLKEREHSPVVSLVHRYRDRALLLVTSGCATYCRFCTRKRNISDNLNRP